MKYGHIRLIAKGQGIMYTALAANLCTNRVYSKFGCLGERNQGISINIRKALRLRGLPSNDCHKCMPTLGRLCDILVLHSAHNSCGQRRLFINNKLVCLSPLPWNIRHPYILEFKTSIHHMTQTRNSRGNIMTADSF